jgi:hypothetical protein
MFNNVPIYEHVTEAMALEDNILNIQAVRTHDQNRKTCYGTRLTLRQLEESRQRYTGEFSHHCQGTKAETAYLFALDQFYYLTDVKVYQPPRTDLVQTPEQERLTAVQEEKCLEKEAGREQVLACCMTPSPMEQMPIG